MSYLVLARKYRPQTFEDLVGQEHVTRTLQNALRSGRLAHAYLFTGARGVGKTTSARILARALNCQASEGPTPSPCGKCSACVEIAAGTDLDVLEMDAASRTGVDDIRELQKSLAYVPTRDRFKVYIVDEVHMLSVSAFNAFLKTLEEPPAHVKFVFATTEPHKVPVTVLSRCQRYDFRLIETDVIRGALESILAREQIAIDPTAVALVAREAAGSMRDALSLLDQVVAFGGGGEAGAIDAAEVARVLGIADRRQLFGVGAALVERDPRRALELVADVAQSGHDLVHFSKELLGHLRNLVVVKIAPDPGRLIDAPDVEKRDLAEQAGKRALVDLERLFLGFSRAFEEIAKSSTPRLLLEMAVARLAHEEPLLPVDDLLGRLESLERRLGGAGAGGTPARSPSGRPAPSRGELAGAPTAAAPSAAAPAAAAPSATAPAASAAAPIAAVPSAATPTATVPSAATPTATAPSAATPTATAASAAAATAPSAATATAAARAAPTAAPIAAAATAAPIAASPPAAPIAASPPAATSAPLAASPPARPAVVPAPRAVVAVAAPGPTVAATPAVAGPRPVATVASAAVAPAKAAASAAPRAAVLAPAVDPAAVLDAWRAVLERVGEDNKVLRGVLEHAVPVAVSVEGVHVMLPPDSLHGRIASGRDNVEVLRRVVERHYGRPVPVQVSLARPEPGTTLRSSSEVRAAEVARDREARVRAAEALPAVRTAVQVFGGAVKSVKTELE